MGRSAGNRSAARVLLLACLLLVGLVPSSALFASPPERDAEAVLYGYDSPTITTTGAANAGSRAFRGYDDSLNVWRLHLRLSGAVLAAKEVPKFTQRTMSETFAHGPFAGRSIGDVAQGLRAGDIRPSDLPVEVVRRGGETLALNTRSTLALRRGGIDPSDWVIRDVTGNPAAERLLTRRLARIG